jgi:thioredoxin 1
MPSTGSKSAANSGHAAPGTESAPTALHVGDKEKHMSEKIVTLSDATFDEHVKGSDVPVLVDFWAEWCGPCKMISPVLEEIAEEHAGKIQIGKLNIDDNLEVTRRFDVMSIPTLILFKNGEPEVRLIGAKPKGQLLQEISAYL